MSIQLSEKTKGLNGCSYSTTATKIERKEHMYVFLSCLATIIFCYILAGRVIFSLSLATENNSLKQKCVSYFLMSEDHLVKHNTPAALR